MENQHREGSFIRREPSSDCNVRYIGYNLLKDVTHNGEPVVPAILGEKTTKLWGRHFEVEHLPGMDFTDYLSDPDVSIVEKLLVLLHIIEQLQAIDKKGFVIFDRHGNNIRVLSASPDHISTRQMDIEQLYDKDANCVYAQPEREPLEELLDNLQARGSSVWTPSVQKLASEGKFIGKVHNDQEIRDTFSGVTWGSSLEDIKRVCIKILKKRSKNTRE